MRALSLRQPWLNAVLYLGKTIENRRWRVSYRGPLLLHAAIGMTKKEYRDAVAFCRHAYIGDSPLFVSSDRRWEFAKALSREQLLFGGIIGRATLVDIVLPNPARQDVYTPLGVHGAWHMLEQFGWILRDVEPMPYVPLKGQRGLFHVDEDLLPASYRRMAS